MIDIDQTINDIAKDCSTEGWDSYNSKAITLKTAELAKDVAIAISVLYPDEKWDIVPCPGGEIDIINEGERKLISVIEFDK